MAYSKAQIDRIGNLLVYITSKLGPTPKTKLLKLIYIIEEESVKLSGMPFTALTYTYFPLGPVSTFVNTQIDKKRETIKQYITITGTSNSMVISPNAEFNGDEFSDFDLQLVDNVLAKFGSSNSDKLIDYTHRDGSLWKQLHDEHNGEIPPSGKRDFDLLKLLDEEEMDQEIRFISKEEKAFINYLTSQE